MVSEHVRSQALVVGRVQENGEIESVICSGDTHATRDLRPW
jgi:hypothetical protein